MRTEDSLKCSCDTPKEGKYICIRCGKPLPKTDAKYQEYVKLCEAYGEQIALRLVYG